MRIQDILIKPVVTEKALNGNAKGVYVFQVTKDASKNQVREVIEKLFKVEVASVASVTTKGKVRKVGRRLRARQLPDVKKMYITLKKGSIDIVPSSA
jgi:large subunit ribosomal protein L23